MKKRTTALLATCLFTSSMLAAAKPDFSGSWQFAPKLSKNIGMMSGMSMLATIAQTPESIQATYDVGGGMTDRLIQRFDLSGKSVDNPTQMGGHAETTSELTSSALVTTWTSEGSIAGTKVTRTETWTLSADAKQLIITSVRGKGAPVVMVFEKRQ